MITLLIHLQSSGIKIPIMKTIQFDDRLVFIMGIYIPGKMVLVFRRCPGDRINIKMSSYQYRDPHVKDVIFNMEIPIPGKDGLYIQTSPGSLYARQFQAQTK